MSINYYYSVIIDQQTILINQLVQTLYMWQQTLKLDFQIDLWESQQKIIFFQIENYGNLLLQNYYECQLILFKKININYIDVCFLINKLQLKDKQNFVEIVVILLFLYFEQFFLIANENFAFFQYMDKQNLNNQIIKYISKIYCDCQVQKIKKYLSKLDIIIQLINNVFLYYQIISKQNEINILCNVINIFQLIDYQQ
eukprot:TRINITY_DN10371_c1_g1_i4.p7 TRINITY_DN10371_c1_g1~~TRINITY_DN10371_c1_g1_i4.p7  ORF type:complete len:198 (-),score=1.66 TRINITY_DN10371_c1_g1_i4:1494-2087(-)